MNILTQENVQKYNTKGATTGIGEYIRRNNIWCMNIQPHPFYKNYGDDSYILKNEFVPNTQYIISLWIDGDSVVSGTTYYPCGFYLYYTDGTYLDLCITGGDNKGFQHKNIVTDASKSASHIYVRYYDNKPTYYRLDSYITPLSNLNQIYQNGIFESKEITEQINVSSDFVFKNGAGYAEARDFIEW